MRRKNICVHMAVSILLLFLAIYLGKTMVRAEPGHGITEEISKRQELSLPLGEKVENPWNETVESSNEELLMLTEDGYLETRGRGEVEVVVRYRIKIEGDSKDSGIPRPILSGKEEMQEPETPKDEVEIETEEIGDGAGFDNQDEISSDTTEEHTGSQEHEQLEDEASGNPTPEEEHNSQSGTPPILDNAAPVLQPGADKPVITYDEGLKNMVVASDFVPRIHLRDAEEYEIISCAVNGREESYQVEGSDLVISQKALGTGKNRIMVTVKDKEGKLYVMEPWEFIIEEQEKSSEDQNGQEHLQEIDKGIQAYEQEQGVSLGMLLLLTGGSFVFYEKKRYGKQE